MRARKSEYWNVYRRSQNWSENVFSRVHSRAVAFAIVRTNSSRYWVYQNWLEKDGNRKFYDFLRMKSYGRSHGIFIEWKCKMKEYEKTWQQCYFGVQYILVREYFISWMNKHSRNSRNVIHNEMYYVYSIWYIWVACFWFEFGLLWFQWLVNRWALVYRYGWIRIDPLQTKRMLRTVVHNYPNLHEMPVARGTGLGK